MSLFSIGACLMSVAVAFEGNFPTMREIHNVGNNRLAESEGYSKLEDMVGTRVRAKSRSNSVKEKLAERARTKVAQAREEFDAKARQAEEEKNRKAMEEAAQKAAEDAAREQEELDGDFRADQQRKQSLEKKALKRQRLNENNPRRAYETELMKDINAKTDEKAQLEWEEKRKNEKAEKKARYAQESRAREEKQKEEKRKHAIEALSVITNLPFEGVEASEVTKAHLKDPKLQAEKMYGLRKLQEYENRVNAANPKFIVRLDDPERERVALSARPYRFLKASACQNMRIVRAFMNGTVNVPYPSSWCHENFAK